MQTERNKIAVYADYTQAELDAAYSQAVWAANMQTILARWASGAADIRAGTPGYREIRYGADVSERLDLYPAQRDGRIVHVHIHGGAWRAQSKDDCAFLAPLMDALDVDLVVPEFGQLPEVRMPRVLQQLIAALRWAHDHAIRRGRDRIILSGHSSGAHMAALLAAQDWEALGIPSERVMAVICISGAYDLEPVLLSARSAYIDLTAAEALALSPIRHAARMQVPVHVLYGARESPEFIRQARAFAAALHRHGRLARCTEMSDLNHFEVVDGFFDPAAHAPFTFRDLIAAAQPHPVRSGLI